MRRWTRCAQSCILEMANGKSGAPAGNSNRQRGERIKAAADAVLKARGKGCANEGLKKLLDALYEEAVIKGDVSAAREFLDRCFGKSLQGVELSGPDGGSIKVSATDYTDDELMAIVIKADSRGRNEP